MSKMINSLESRINVFRNMIGETNTEEVNNMYLSKIEVLESVVEELSEGHTVYVPRTVKSNEYSEVIPEFNSSKIAGTENSDCVVKTFASMFEIEYDEAHKFTQEQFGRVYKNGVHNTADKLAGMKEAFGKEITRYGRLTHKQANGNVTGLTLARFLDRFPRGEYMVLVRQHMFGVRNGVVIGNLDDARSLRKIVKNVFRLDKVEVELND